MFSVMIKHTYAGSIWNELCSILLKRYIYEDLHYRQYPLVQKLPVKSWSLGSEKSWLHKSKVTRNIQIQNETSILYKNIRINIFQQHLKTPI